MLSFVDTRILLLLAVTSFLASCQSKFDYLLCFFFFFFCDGYFFFGSHCLRILRLAFVWDLHEGQPEDSAKHCRIKLNGLSSCRRILHSLFFFFQGYNSNDSISFRQTEVALLKKNKKRKRTSELVASFQNFSCMRCYSN